MILVTGEVVPSLKLELLTGNMTFPAGTDVRTAVKETFEPVSLVERALGRERLMSRRGDTTTLLPLPPSSTTLTTVASAGDVTGGTTGGGVTGGVVVGMTGGITETVQPFMESGPCVRSELFKLVDPLLFMP